MTNPNLTAAAAAAPAASTTTTPTTTSSTTKKKSSGGGGGDYHDTIMLDLEDSGVIEMNDLGQRNHPSGQVEDLTYLTGNQYQHHHHHHHHHSSTSPRDEEKEREGDNEEERFSTRANDSTPPANAVEGFKGWTLRRLALDLSLYCNLMITVVKLVAYIRTRSLSVLAALLDSVLDVVSQGVLNYTEKRSSMHRSSAFYPAGAARLEPIGVLTCAALMGMASFEVLKESITTLIYQRDILESLSLRQERYSFWSMVGIVIVKLMLLALCKKAARRPTFQGQQTADPTLEALAQDHLNDCLSNTVAAIALICVMVSANLWIVDPIGAIVISFYIIYSWYHTGKEQIEQLTGKSAPKELIEELLERAENFDERMIVDTIRAYHFGPKFLVELEVVLPRDTLLVDSHDLGMELQYEIEGREEVERCFVHIDYETRDYDEHVVSKVPALREQILRRRVTNITADSSV